MTVDTDREGPSWARETQLITAVRQRVARHPGALHTQQRLAAELGVSSSILNAAFKRRLGISIAVYVRSERLRIAKRLLLQTSMSIQDIARELGFSGPANFSTSFRQHVGVSPTEFRNGPPALRDLMTTDPVKWGE